MPRNLNSIQTMNTQKQQDGAALAPVAGSSPSKGDIYKHPNIGYVELVRKWNDREWVVEEVATKRRSLRFLELMERMPASFCVPSEQPWPPMESISVERCEHGMPKPYLCRECQDSNSADEPRAGSALSPKPQSLE